MSLPDTTSAHSGSTFGMPRRISVEKLSLRSAALARSVIRPRARTALVVSAPKEPSDVESIPRACACASVGSLPRSPKARE